MSTVTGTVEKVWEKNTNKGKAYSLIINTGDGDDTWVSVGFDKPSVSEGTRVSLNTKSRESNGKTYYNLEGDIKVLGEAAQAARSTAGTGGARQESIVVQSSLKSAVELVGIALANGALSVGSGNASKKYATLMSIVMETTRDLANIALNPVEFLNEGKEESEDEDDEDWSPMD